MISRFPLNIDDSDDKIIFKENKQNERLVRYCLQQVIVLFSKLKIIK